MSEQTQTQKTRENGARAVYVNLKNWSLAMAILKRKGLSLSQVLNDYIAKIVSGEIVIEEIIKEK